MPTCHASATWEGGLRGGKGTFAGESGTIGGKFDFVKRFGDEQGSNPEEMLAAAEASCFSMALSAGLGRMGHTPTEIRTTATLTLHKGAQGFKITKIHLATEGKVPGIDQATFQEAAEGAKSNCPVSVLLKPGLEEISLDAKLVS